MAPDDSSLLSAKFISHLSINTPQALINSIYEQYRADSPVKALRSAELVIYSRLQALSDYRHALLESRARQCRIERQLHWLKLMAWAPTARYHIAMLDLELDKIKANNYFTAPLVRDAQVELNAAQACRDYLLEIHPELLEYVESYSLGDWSKRNQIVDKNPSLLGAATTRNSIGAAPLSFFELVGQPSKVHSSD